MQGHPVWLASVSCRRGDRLLASTDWRDRFDWAVGRLRSVVLRGVGDETRERLFRMNVTLCLHRAVSDAELEGFPAGWKCSPGGLAGGPVEILWSKGVVESPSCRPCENPRWDTRLEPDRPDLALPIDCGRCGPCLARKHIAETGLLPAM